MKVVFLSYHYWFSKRKAGFHFLAEAFLELGAECLFITSSISRLSLVKRDYRTKCPHFNQAVNQIYKVSDKLNISVWMPLFHPFKAKMSILNIALSEVFELYPLLPISENIILYLKQANIIIFESTSSILLLQRFKHINPQAKFVYRASDDLDMIDVPQIVKNYEKKNLHLFDLVSVPSQFLRSKLSKYSDKVKYHSHGFNKELFEKKYTNPYQDMKVNALFVGTGDLDYEFLQIAANVCTNWVFHIIGPVPRSIKEDNIIYYGEVSYENTIPYIQHADVGLAIRVYRQGSENLQQSSLKLMQFKYYSLPIILPSYMHLPEDSYPLLYSYRSNEIEEITNLLDKVNDLLKKKADIYQNRISYTNKNESHFPTWLNLAQSIMFELGLFNA